MTYGKELDGYLDMPVVRQSLQAALDAATGMAVVLDPRGRVVLANDVYTRAAGRSSKQLQGANAISLSPPELRDERERRLGAAMRTREVVRYGDERAGRQYLNTIAPILDPSGGCAGAFMTAVELTGELRQRAERERAEARLQAVEKMAVTYRLASGVAHDFNNLLMVMLGFTEQIVEREDRGPTHDDAVAVAECVKRAAALTRRLLSFAHPQNGGATTLTLDDALANMQDVLSRLVGGTIEVAVDAEAGVEVQIDPGSFQQLVINLVTNACDAMPDGGRVHLRTDLVEEDGLRFARLSIDDDGHGLTDEAARRAFEPFFTTKDPKDGTGLGLHTVRGLLARRGGRVRLQPRVGGGTTAEVLFVIEEERPAAVPPAPCSHHRDHRRILVVDDDRGVRNVVGRVLERAQYEVHLAGGMDEALMLRSKLTPLDLVVTDVTMLGGAGPELVRVLREKQPELRALYMTGGLPVEPGPNGDETLLKPFSTNDLLSRVESLVRRAN